MQRARGLPRIARTPFRAGHILWTDDEVHTPIAGEDRSLGGNLLGYEPHGPTMPLLADLLDRDMFLDLKRLVVRRSEFKCEACGRTNFQRPFDRWEYDKRSKIRTLRRLLCLCKQCHIASLRKFDRPLHPLDPRDAQMRRGRDITYEQLQVYAAEQQRIIEGLAKIKWRSDISILTQRAFAKLPAPNDRLIVNYPDPPVAPPADRIAVRFVARSLDSGYRRFTRLQSDAPAFAEAKRLWPLLKEYTADEISAITGIKLYRLHHVLGSRQVAAYYPDAPKGRLISNYREPDPEADKRAMAKAKKLWPRIDKYLTLEIVEITGINLTRLYNVLGPRRVAAAKLSGGMNGKVIKQRRPKNGEGREPAGRTKT
ncbi:MULTISPECIES: hypothetical protein [unclassified Acidiphilium]|uniref:hypothetical protein n=2 Tax=Acidiphilium TaxID=522 RepID=UPI000BDCE637|nr:MULTISPECIES: hypothetical protein [unclassified Acidiphilium]OZB22915.1 MAG: hypothetical protein B7X49_16560 [Acidiphilium sp. 34-64-41]